MGRAGADRRPTRTASGLAIALLSAFSFGLAGPFAAALLAVGWSPLAVALGRLAGTAVLLGVPLALVVARGWRRHTGHLGIRHLRAVVVYGIVPLAGAQVCYFNAVDHLSVGVALLIEYTAPVLLLGWMWARGGARPKPATLLGAALAVAGLVLVLDVARGAEFDVVGVLWGLAAAVCLAAYFRLSADASDENGPPALVLTAGGAIVGSAVVVLVGAVGLLPLTATTTPISLAGWTAPWWVGVVLVAALSTTLAYLTGIAAVGRLGSRLASFVGLSEVLFAVLGAWWLVSQRPTLTQVAGGVLVVAAIALIRWAEPPT